MHPLVQKFRNLLEASWALSPTMVVLACVTLDLAALLHLPIKATHPAMVETFRDRRPREQDLCTPIHLARCLWQRFAKL